MEKLPEGFHRYVRVVCTKHCELRLSKITVVRHETEVSLVYFTRECCQCTADAHSMRLNTPEPPIEVLREEDFDRLIAGNPV